MHLNLYLLIEQLEEEKDQQHAKRKRGHPIRKGSKLRLERVKIDHNKADLQSADSAGSHKKQQHRTGSGGSGKDNEKVCRLFLFPISVPKCLKFLNEMDSKIKRYYQQGSPIILEKKQALFFENQKIWARGLFEKVRFKIGSNGGCYVKGLGRYKESLKVSRFCLKTPFTKISNSPCVPVID